MKVIAVMLAVVALISSAAALKDAVCGLPHSSSGDGTMSCRAYMPSWSYKLDSNECVEFVYGGCGGNGNRFGSKDVCEQKCKE